MRKTHCIASAAILSAFALQTGQTEAATISFAGTETAGTVVSDWRTVGTAKSKDIDGSNVYGDSIGAVIWGQASTGEQGAGSTNLSWAYVSDSGQYGGDGRYSTVDNLPASAKTPAGIAALGNPGTFSFVLNGVAGDYAGKTVRVGVMADVLGSDEVGLDTNKTFELTGPAAATSGVVNLPPGNQVIDMYFFDITGVVPGEQYTLRTTSGTGQAGYIGPVSWDIGVVPEPATAGLLAIGSLAALRRRRA